ncbi:hypothetical protein X943_002013 [Babesia divergens]|uniref:Uncharacterized protein n=1 Tax=Babesia divergens TaxID=32595 RepID=A0AAD9GE96_BABDI|nr:hypothetical protein X943_002013 [Babesia divergens]
MDNGIKKAKHFSCKRYREDRSFFLASVFMRALSEYHEIPTDDFISYWALRTDTFAAFGNDSVDVSQTKSSDETPTVVSDAGLNEQDRTKACEVSQDLDKIKVLNNIDITLPEYQVVADSQKDCDISTPCMLRHHSSSGSLSETSREDSDVSSDCENIFKEDFNTSQTHDEVQIKNSIFYDGDFDMFVQRQKLLYRVIEDLQSSVFVSKPSIDFVPEIDLESIERDYIVLDPKMLGSQGLTRPITQAIRQRQSEDILVPAKRACIRDTYSSIPRPTDYTLERALKNCADCGTQNILEKSVHLQKLVSILSGANPAEVYTNEILDGICTVKSMCAKTHAKFGANAFFAPSLKHPIDSISDSMSNKGLLPGKQLITDNTLYSPKNSFMIPKNLVGQMTTAKGKEGGINGLEDDEEEDSNRLRIPRMSNSKLAHFVEALCGVNFDQSIIKNSLEQNAKECCDLRSLIQFSRNESDGNPEHDSKLPTVTNEYFTNTSNHLAFIDSFDTTEVSYYNNRVLPNDSMEFYFNATSCDYKNGNLIRMQGGGPLDISSDIFTTFDNRRHNMSHYLEAIGALEERIREVQGRSEKMHRTLHLYSQQAQSNGINDLQEMFNLETLLLVSDTLMETKRRLHTELRRKVQDELDMINHILPEPLADSLTRILYPSMDH